MLTSRFLFSSTIGLCTLLGLPELMPQAEPADCEARGREVLQGRFAEADVQFLSRCPSSGPVALARVWSRPLDRSSELMTAIVEASIKLRDARLYRSLLAVGGQSRRSSTDRLAALQVLTAYYDPSFFPTAAYLTSAAEGDPIPVRLHRAGRPGAEPLPDSRSAEFLHMLARLSAADSDPLVRAAARRLRAALAATDPENTPIPGGAVTLTAGCGTRVTLGSTADIGLPIRVQVLESTFDHTYSLRGATRESPVKVLLSLPPGTVVASYGGREVARLVRREAPCPPGVLKG
jgi:hypothetical protein